MYNPRNKIYCPKTQITLWYIQTVIRPCCNQIPLHSAAFHPPLQIFAIIRLRRASQRIVVLHPVKDILNSHTIFVNIKKGTSHVGEMSRRLCPLIFIFHYTSPSVCGPSRWERLLREIEGYGSKVMSERVFRKTRPIIVVLKKSERFALYNDDVNAKLAPKLIDKWYHAICWLVESLGQALSFAALELNSNFWDKLLFRWQAVVVMEFFNDKVWSLSSRL